MVSVSPSLLFSISATGQSGRTSPARPFTPISIIRVHTTGTRQALTPAQMQRGTAHVMLMRSRSAKPGLTKRADVEQPGGHVFLVPGSHAIVHLHA